METVSEALLGITAYPVPMRTIETIAVKRGLNLVEFPTSEILNSKGFLLAEADILMWICRAPNISQGGQSYSLTDEQRKEFLARARGIYSKYGDADDKSKTGIIYGYKGQVL